MYNLQDDTMTATDGSLNSGFVAEQEICKPDTECHNAMTVNSTYHLDSQHRSDTDDNIEKELQHASYMTRSSSDHSIASSALRVDIADIEMESSLNLTTTQLRKCKRQVLRPYFRLLVFIGWRGFGREYVNSGSIGWKILNIFYPVFIMLMLFYTYGYEIIACQWKLNLQKDTQIVTTTTSAPTTSTPRPGNHTTAITFPMFSMVPAKTEHHRRNASEVDSSFPQACEHIITTYVVPNILHFVAYVMGLLHFRIQENEQLYALMENVFLQASPSHKGAVSQQTMIRNMRAFFLLGVVWILLTMGMQGLYEWAFDFPNLAFFISTGPKIHYFLFAIELYGILIINSVILAVVTNYYTQCEMILFYVKGLVFRLQEKSDDLKSAMKTILSIRHSLSVLNGPIAMMTSLVSVILAELTIIGVTIVVLNKNNQYKVWIYRSLYPIIWFCILAVPLTQAARVNSVCNRFRKIALEIRVFGYKNVSNLDLDSFLNFICHASLRAKLFHIPILPSYIIAFVVLGLFVLLILLQTSVIGTEHFF